MCGGGGNSVPLEPVYMTTKYVYNRTILPRQDIIRFSIHETMYIL